MDAQENGEDKKAPSENGEDRTKIGEKKNEMKKLTLKNFYGEGESRGVIL